MTEVNLHHLSKSYDSQHEAVRDLCLTLPAGKITALLGPSGCGKTTVLKLIAGLLNPGRGDILFGGESVVQVPPEKRKAAMVFQHHLLFPHLSVQDNVAFGLKMRGLGRTEIAGRVAQMLELVRLPDFGQRRPQELSGGQQQRVALARALIVEPTVLLLDEPLSNLDAHLRYEMRELILNVQRQLGITTMVVTHDQEEAVILGDLIALMFEGQLQQVGPPRLFYEKPATRHVARFFGGVNFIPATKKGTRVETCWGAFQTKPSSLPDGPVLMTIRPEQVQLQPAPGGPNCLQGKVLDHLYAGTHTRFKIQVPNGSVGLTVESVTSSGPLDPGQEVAIHLPAEQIWLLPNGEL